MSDEPIECPECERTFNQRQFITKTAVVEACPHCRAVVNVSTTEQLNNEQTNVVAKNLQDAGEIATWLERFAAETGLIVKKREVKENEEELWVITTPHPFAFECRYDCHYPGVVTVRGMTKKHAETVLAEPRKFNSIAAIFGVQVGGGKSMKIGGEGEYGLDAFWCVFQLFKTEQLTSSLLNAVIGRLSQVMEKVLSEMVKTD